MYSQVRNVHGPITFHLLKKGEKKIYLFGDRHYKDPAKCPSSQNIVSLLNDIKEKHNFFVEGNCREVRDFELTNYICEILKNVKPFNTRNIFYSDRRYTHLDYIMNVKKILESFSVNNYIIFIISFYSYKYEANEEEENEEKANEEKANEDIAFFESLIRLKKTTEYKVKTILTNFNEGIKLADVENILNILQKLNKEEYNQLCNYGRYTIGNFQQSKFETIMMMAENIFNMIYKKNKNEGETLENFVERLRQQQLEKHNVNTTIQIPQKAKKFFQDDKTKEIFQKMDAEISSTAGVYMDVYLLASFLLSNINNNVVYAGDFHVKVYVDILKNLGFTKEFSYENNNQCTPLGNTKLPLFSFR
jgi:hypothetical protein